MASFTKHVQYINDGEIYAIVMLQILNQQPENLEEEVTAVWEIVQPLPCELRKSINEYILTNIMTFSDTSIGVWHCISIELHKSVTCLTSTYINNPQMSTIVVITYYEGHKQEKSWSMPRRSV